MIRRKPKQRVLNGPVAVTNSDLPLNGCIAHLPWLYGDSVPFITASFFRFERFETISQQATVTYR